MKKQVFLSMVISAVIGLFLFGSCMGQTDEQNEPKNEFANAIAILKKYGNIHNDGLDYIKADKVSVSGFYTEARLDSVFEEYVFMQIGNENFNEVMNEIAPFKNQLREGRIPSLVMVRSGEYEGISEDTNPIAVEALNEASNKITNYLHSHNEDEILDNATVLSELQNIISKEYIKYLPLCKNTSEVTILEQSLGTFYGSVEYWTKSSNVKQWSNLNSDNDILATRAKNEKRKLTVPEYLSVVGAADAIGALVHPVAAVIASGAAALYYDVE